MLKALASKRIIDKDTKTIEFYSYIKDLLQNKDVSKMGLIKHHFETSCLQHCINVAYYNYKLAKLLKLDKRSLSIGGLLHDMYLYDRKTYVRPKGERMHGFSHPLIALHNADNNFKLNDLEKEIILKHMWPLTLSLPHHKETFIIIIVDKYCCMAEIFCHFGKVMHKAFLHSALFISNIL